MNNLPKKHSQKAWALSSTLAAVAIGLIFYAVVLLLAHNYRGMSVKGLTF